MERILETKSAPRANIERLEMTGDCFKEKGRENHFFCVEDDHILHVRLGDNNDCCINTLYDNHLTDMKCNHGIEYTEISLDEFSEALNQAIFAMNIFDEKYKR